ncbi:hypothetical protein BC828DRAFT_404182 [Blastocladiella britannica]|nr:hypothetical protein BC828DRAFT_404182 [Blastocladiella britannica]
MTSDLPWGILAMVFSGVLFLFGACCLLSRIRKQSAEAGAALHLPTSSATSLPSPAVFDQGQQQQQHPSGVAKPTPRIESMSAAYGPQTPLPPVIFSSSPPRAAPAPAVLIPAYVDAWNGGHGISSTVSNCSSSTDPILAMPIPSRPYPSVLAAVTGATAAIKPPMVPISVATDTVLVAHWPYTPSNPDELDLMPGDQVVVETVFDDGWICGINARSGISGMAPLTLLLPPPTAAPAVRSPTRAPLPLVRDRYQSMSRLRGSGAAGI